MHDILVKRIAQAVTSILQERNLPMPSRVEEGTALFGENGVLDSLALMSLIITTQQFIVEELGVKVELGDDAALSRRLSPYGSIDALASYAVERIDAANNSRANPRSTIEMIG